MNHFCEVGTLTNGDYAFTIHTGSRNLGHRIATHWQAKAADYCNGQLKSAKDRIIQSLKQAHDEGRITGQEVGAGIVKAKADYPAASKGTEYLEGQLMQEYLRDTYMAQAYAELNRATIASQIASALHIDVEKYVCTTHNTVGRDGIARKGAVQAYVGMLVAIPMNRVEGTWICQVTRNSQEHLWTLPHGAGREGSRKWAKGNTTQEDADQEMRDAGIESSINPRDEATNSYKNPDKIYAAIKDRIVVVDVITPFLNIK